MTSREDEGQVDKAKTVATGCTCDCGGRCPLKVHVENGTIVRIEGAGGDDLHLRACARGYAYRQRVYGPDRLQFPMKRVGARGEGKFERITWDEALDTVASRLTEVKETYGPSSILYLGISGSWGLLHGRVATERLLNMFGGCTTHWGVISCEGPLFASAVTYGGMFTTANTPDDFINSKMIILWGWDPAESSRASTPFLMQAKEAGARIVCVDPKYTRSAALLADKWIPIRPSTDAAMLIAMAYVIITENLQDQAFIDTYTIGFEQYKDYVLGKEDGIPKTANWAESATGVPADVIADLAREYATMKPAALAAGFGPGRTAYGEQYHRASTVLAAITGNVGIHGGYPGLVGHLGYIPAIPILPLPLGRCILPLGDNPVTDGGPPTQFNSVFYSPSGIHICKLADAILQGKAGGYPTNLKLAYITCSNPVNQLPNSNKMAEALQKLEFIVVHEVFMAPTAKFADILLPVNTALERNDIPDSWLLSPPYYTYINKAIDPVHESKTDLQICGELANRLGISDYNDKTEDELLREAVQSVEAITDYDDFKRKGILNIALPEYVPFKEQIEDPDNNPFPTASGKIEIYSQQLADLNDPKLPPIPKYFEPHEESLREKYPLQVFSTHAMTRCKSQFSNIPWLEEIEPQTLWINPVDAQTRGISDGDLVRVLNDQGQMMIIAKVTETIMPGVISMLDGAWYDPDERGLDRGGCDNVLTLDNTSPAGACTCNSALAQVERV